MPNRTAKFASAIVVSLLAGTPLATLAQGAPPAAADDCLSGPKNPAPAGSHWRYHIDRATKRHCWYLRDEHNARAQPANSVASATSSAAAKPVSPDAPAAMQSSVANAHAELPASQTAAGANAGATAPWPAATPSAAGDGRGTNATDANAQRSQIGSRWPGQSDATSSASSEPAADDTATQASDAATASAATSVPIVAADVPPTKQSSSLQTLLMVMTGALALAGLVGSAVVRFGRSRRDPQPDRRAIWDSAMTDLSPRPGFPSAGVPMPRLGLPNELRAADDPDQRIAHMLTRLARSARA